MDTIKNYTIMNIAMGQSITKEMETQRSFDSVACKSGHDYEELISVIKKIIEEVPWATFDKVTVSKDSDNLEINIDLCIEDEEENAEYHTVMILKKIDNLPFESMHFVINFVTDDKIIDSLFCDDLSDASYWTSSLLD